MDAMSYKESVIEFKMKKEKSLEALRRLDMEIVVDNSIDTDANIRAKRTGVEDVQSVVIDESFDKIKDLDGISSQKKLTQQSVNTQKKVSQSKVRESAKRFAGKYLKKVGKGIEASSTAFSFAQGGVDVAAGSDIIDKAEELRNSGAITEDEYDTMMRNGQLRVAQGSFGIATGVKNVGEFIGNKLKKTITKKIAKKAGTVAGKLLKQTARFAPVIGGMISMGTTATSIAKNAMAAHDAVQSGNTGKAVMYGIMAAVDVVTLILDGASLVTDFVFPPLSPIIDLVSTVLQVVNTVLGFFADLIDFRSTEQRVRDEFNSYINSEAFKTYVKDMAEKYKERGFDVFTYIVDAEVAGIEADTKTLRDESKNINKCLTKKAKEDFNNPNLRIALLDATSLGKTLHGRANNDEIIAGFGPDEIYGEEGDDVLFGRGGDDTIYGGPGNDYLNGGTGRDVLLGGEGDDIVNCEPAIDKKCQGEEGDDILELSGQSLIYDDNFFKQPYITMGKQWEINSANVSPVKGIYLNMAQPIGFYEPKATMWLGLSLGSCFQGWPEGFDERYHKPAIQFNDKGKEENKDLARQFIEYFNTFHSAYPDDVNRLNGKTLWFIAEIFKVKYFCDGRSLYIVYPVKSNQVRIIDNFLTPVETQYAVHRNDRLQYKTPEKKLQALFTFAFWTSTLPDRFETLAAAPPEDPKTISNYIPTTIIGDSEDNVIDVSYGLGDVVYTGNGNNVVSVGTTAPEDQVGVPGNADGGFEFAKYIVGGNGDNTVVIQTMHSSSCEKVLDRHWVLADIKSNARNVVYGRFKNAHVILLKNIGTVEVRAPPSNCESNVRVNAEYYHGAGRFILDNTAEFMGPSEEGKEVVVLPKRLRIVENAGIYFRFGSIGTISFRYYQDENNKISKIDISPDYQRQSMGEIEMRSGEKLNVRDVQNVIGTSSCQQIIGNNDENLLMAVGGETTIEGKDGDDTLVSGRGRHVLNGGEGGDTYVIQGPDVEEVLTISVNMGDDGKTITCRTSIYGNWKDAEKELEIDLLQDDHNDVVLTSVEIIPAEGDDKAKLGSIAIDDTNKKILFRPGENFNFLKRNKAKVVRVKYTTTGSTTTIKDDDIGNVLRFDSIKSFDDLNVKVVNNELIFREKSSNKVVLIYQEWKKLEHKTNLLDYILDFAQRFPSILFKQSEDDFTRSTKEEIVKIIYENLKYLERELGQDYDSFIDSDVLPSDVGKEIYVGNGQNVVLAKAKGKTYRLGEKSSGSLIIANKFTEGSGKVVIKSGEKYSLTQINTVVVGVKSGGAVEIQKMHHNIIITGANQDEVTFYTCGKKNNYICANNVKSKKFLILKGGLCQKLIFKKKKNVNVIMNCNDYLKSKTDNDDSTPAWPIIVSHGKKMEYKLTLPIKKDESQIKIYAKNAETPVLQVYFKNGKDKPWPDEKWRASYLVIPTENPVPKAIDTKMLVNAMISQFKGGIEFADGEHVAKDGICQLVVDLINKHPPAKFTMTNKDLQCENDAN